MDKYESLEKLYYKRKNVEEEYNSRISNPCAYNTEL